MCWMCCMCRIWLQLWQQLLLLQLQLQPKLIETAQSATATEASVDAAAAPAPAPLTISKQINSCCRRKRAAPVRSKLKSNCERSETKPKQTNQGAAAEQTWTSCLIRTHLAGICSAGFACRKNQQKKQGRKKQ